ncbi:MAG TPA: outer membrane beta-barrel family protein [Bacteroidia bacterium]|nr:outer membrane beta-barrel family protein [Bacteroidia bacterium]
MKKLVFWFLLLSTYSTFAQKISVKGNVQDTTAREPLSNALIMAIKLMDSTLVNYTRSDEKGFFNINALPVDTYQVIITHPKFADMGFFIFGDSTNLEYDFGKIILQPKNIDLHEVTIYAFKDPVYYKGDTLIYTADSFKTKANANVEDLLKKLPGLSVDASGKITSQGKSIDKVLVDGDEFFGSDPTMATKNLAASSIESVQVYEKKSDDAANSSTGEETQNILNLQLKEEAKKGYFGKISGASDFKKFHEGEMLGNYFKNKLKVSVFGLASNTPNSSFNWEDVYRYGLDNEFQTVFDDDGGSTSMFMTGQPQGIPQTIKSGFYYSNKLFKDTKFNINYSYDNSQVNATKSENSQYFLPDTTYNTFNNTNAFQKNEAHTINIGLEQALDSLTDLNFSSKIKSIEINSTSLDKTDFLRSDFIKTRNTTIDNFSKSNGYDIANNLKLVRRFKKEDRELRILYSNSFSENSLKGILKTDNYFYFDSINALNSINQKKQASTNANSHILGFTYTEPLTNKIKVEFSYDYMQYKSSQNKLSLNKIGDEYSQIDPLLTNDFLNIKKINRLGLKFIYEVKKLRFTLGTKARNVFVRNDNLFTNHQIIQNFNNILPFSTVRYKFSDNRRIELQYTTTSANPTINQLQPITDNNNPNFINIGNPDLLPTFNHNIKVNYNSWKAISGKYTWISFGYNYINNNFTNFTTYDSIGRTVSKTVNVDGNYNLNSSFGTNLPFFSKKLVISPYVWVSYRNNKSFINGLMNKTQDFRSNLNLQFQLDFEKVESSISGYYNYNYTEATLNINSTKPYSSQGFSGSINIKLPAKFIMETNADYTINSKRSEGYNVNYLIWNANLSKSFFKQENVILGLFAYDILNQNTNVDREINSNIITDSKTNIITRYFLIKVTYKFNSTHSKEEDEGF